MPTLEERVTELERQMAELNRYVAGNDPRPRSERPLEPKLLKQIEDLLDAKLDAKLAEHDRRTARTIEELLQQQKAEIISELKD